MTRGSLSNWLPARRGAVDQRAPSTTAAAVADEPDIARVSPLWLGRAAQGRHVLVGASVLEVGDGPSREQCWADLGPAVTSRVLEVAGPVLGWSASPCPGAAGRVQAVVVGRRALVVADPHELPGPRAPVVTHRVSSYLFDESGLLHVGVAHTPARVFVVAPQRARPPGVDVTVSASPEPALPPGLDDQVVRVITSMPAPARRLLTLPMTATGDTVVRQHCFWQGPSPAFLEVVLVVLASARRVTVANGVRCIPAGDDPSTAHWAVDCWHADVVGRRSTDDPTVDLTDDPASSR